MPQTFPHGRVIFKPICFMNFRDITFFEAPESSMKLFRWKPFVVIERYKGGVSSSHHLWHIVFKITIGSIGFAGIINTFKTSLMTEGILHIYTIGTNTFIFPTMVGTSMFNWISSFVCIGFGSKSWIGGGRGWTPFPVDWDGTCFSRWYGACLYGCEWTELWIRILFLLA